MRLRRRHEQRLAMAEQLVQGLLKTVGGLNKQADELRNGAAAARIAEKRVATLVGEAKAELERVGAVEADNALLHAELDRLRFELNRGLGLSIEPAPR